jgi:hypothetical protein
MLFNERARVGASALKHRLPVMTYVAEEVPYGHLMSYGQDIPDFFRRAVAYTDKILKVVLVLTDEAVPAASRYSPQSAAPRRNYRDLDQRRVLAIVQRIIVVANKWPSLAAFSPLT